jgi:hypothetical protein
MHAHAMHTCTWTYEFSYISRTNTCLRTYMHTSMHGCMNTHTHIHTYIREYMHACIYTYIHADMHELIHKRSIQCPYALPHDPQTSCISAFMFAYTLVHMPYIHMYAFVHSFMAYVRYAQTFHYTLFLFSLEHVHGFWRAFRHLIQKPVSVVS